MLPGAYFFRRKWRKHKREHAMWKRLLVLREDTHYLTWSDGAGGGDESAMMSKVTRSRTATRQFVVIVWQTVVSLSLIFNMVLPVSTLHITWTKIQTRTKNYNHHHLFRDLSTIFRGFLIVPCDTAFVVRCTRPCGRVSSTSTPRWSTTETGLSCETLWAILSSHQLSRSATSCIFIHFLKGCLPVLCFRYDYLCSFLILFLILISSPSILQRPVFLILISFMRIRNPVLS